jgi:hypothetical protein
MREVMIAPAILLFVDFDGVLHPVRSPTSKHFENLPRLEEVLRRHADVRIVLSTSWQDVYPMRALKAMFSEDIAARIIGGTHSADPERQAESRYDAIQLYLLRGGRPGAPWLALDDSEYQFPENCPQLVACDPRQGFNDEAEMRLRVALDRLKATALAA